MKKILIILAILILTGCSKDYSKNIYYMDTIINIKLYNVSESKAMNAFKDIEDIYSKYEKIVSYYDENSELYKLNNSSEDSIQISNELADLISYGQKWYEKSNGLLNINIGALTKVWHDFRNKTISLPNIDYLNSIDISNNINLDNNIINSDNINIDLGAIAKGYVTELAGNYLEQNNIKNYIINAGGNVKVGASLKGYYNIGIQSPIENKSFYVIKGENISVVTSGGYERFYELDNIIYHHIIDPNTRYPANNMKSVTVIGKDSGLCDVLSTTLFIMNIEDGKEFIKDYDVDVIWFTNNDEIIKSDGFKYE